MIKNININFIDQIKKTPFIPKIKYKGDTRNFDSYPELAEDCFNNKEKENLFTSEFIDFQLS